jgi:hypothetical protein
MPDTPLTDRARRHMPTHLSPGLPPEETGQSSRRYRVPLSYLVVYQNSGVAANWVRFPNAFGSVAETFVFQALVIGSGNRRGTGGRRRLPG